MHREAASLFDYAFLSYFPSVRARTGAFLSGSLNVARKVLKVFLLLMPTDLLEEGSQGDLASDYRHIPFMGGVHEEEFHVGCL